jgi:hypothetical protein
VKPMIRDVKTLDEFAEHYIDERDTLALRKLNGETLTPEEDARLAEMNDWLDEHLPKPPPLPPEVQKLLDEYRTKRDAK